MLETEGPCYPKLSQMAAIFGGPTKNLPVPIPLDCTDGFNEAYYGRPEMLLRKTMLASPARPGARPCEVVHRFRAHLADDLATGGAGPAACPSPPAADL